MKWFKHDADANRDPKLEKVLMKYGAEGYALYWLCIELIVDPIDRNNITFELEHDSEILAHRLRMDTLKVEEILRYMVELRLFEINPTTHRVVCMKIATRLENSIVKSPELKKIQQDITEGKKESGIVRDSPGLSGTDKNRLDKKRKDKRTTTAPSVPDDEFFGFFKEAYPERAGGQPWSRARKAIHARFREDKSLTWQHLIDAAVRYAAFCDATGRTGTEYVLQAATFCGPDKRYSEPWEIPPPSGDRKRKPTYAEELAADIAAKGM